jgi:hypothetical protein
VRQWIYFNASHLGDNLDRNSGSAEIVRRFGNMSFSPSTWGLISDFKTWRERMDEWVAKNDIKAAELGAGNSVTESVWRSGSSRIPRA